MKISFLPQDWFKNMSK